MRSAAGKSGAQGQGRADMTYLDVAADLDELAAPVDASGEALYELGMMYAAGRTVQLDLVLAHKWFNLAAMRGNDDAKRYRFEISREMSKPQISRAQRLAREWISKH
jgi:TPR repeat protein